MDPKMFVSDQEIELMLQSSMLSRLTMLGNVTLAIRISCKQMIMERYPSTRSAAEDALE